MYVDQRLETKETGEHCDRGAHNVVILGAVRIKIKTNMIINNNN